MVIASKTGLVPEFIRWELPLWQAWPYYLSARIMEGELFRWPGGKDGRWIEEALERVKKCRVIGDQ